MVTAMDVLIRLKNEMIGNRFWTVSATRARGIVAGRAKDTAESQQEQTAREAERRGDRVSMNHRRTELG